MRLPPVDPLTRRYRAGTVIPLIIRLTARAKEGPETYQPLDRHALRGDIACSGSGDPAEVTIRVTADDDFAGVIRIALCAESRIPPPASSCPAS